MTSDRLDFYYAPHSRANVTLYLLEELGVPYTLHAMNLYAGDQRKPEYMAINPMGKVPAIRHAGALVTEQVAIIIYLGDLFKEKGLAPQMGDPLRGPYLRWLVFYAACLEPAGADRALKREPGKPSMMPYGDFDTTVKTVTDQLDRGRYILGDTFSAADILWGGGLSYMTMFGIIPKTPRIEAYVADIEQRPAVVRAKQIEAGWLKTFGIAT
jgi:glutathione S-transferase